MLKKIALIFGLGLFTIDGISCSASVSVTPSSSPTPILSATPIPSTSVSPMPTPTPSDVASPTPSPTSSPDYNYLIEKAKTASGIAECIAKAESSNTKVTGSVQVTGICFVQGNTKRVTFIASPICNSGEACPQYARLVATVDFDCQDNITASTCN